MPTWRRHVRHAILPAALLVLVVVAVVAVRGSSDPTRTLVGSGVAATDARSLPAFSGVDLTGTAAVAVRLGARQSVIVRGDDNLLGNVTTRVRAGRLEIGTTGDFTTRTPMRVTVTVPALDELRLSGSGTISAQHIQARKLIADLAGTGRLRATGTVERLEASISSGSGSVGLGGLVAREARALLQGSGRIVVTATDRLDASVSGTGSILYGGDPPHVVKRVTGTGAITRGDL
jgi:hypothetical protein